MSAARASMRWGRHSRATGRSRASISAMCPAAASPMCDCCCPLLAACLRFLSNYIHKPSPLTIVLPECSLPRLGPTKAARRLLGD
eukprot:1691612-Pleurochrysis_carterae.AAC.1